MKEESKLPPIQGVVNDVIKEEEEELQDFEDEINRIQEERPIPIPLDRVNQEIPPEL